ncbi:MAG: DUF4280 domain-containing protein [Lachnospiraceae bacterium]|nr:DUF4280 domain-containing protein [Lachnospiraceae bacterium]
MAGKEYVCRLAHMECSCGTKVNYLNAPKDHGIRFDEGEPLLNENDHEPGTGKNIVHFGQCKSLKNPLNLALITATASISSTCLGAGALVGGPLGMLVIGGAVVDTFGGCKCNPKTFTPWEDVSDKMEDKVHIVEGAPALSTDHQLTCMYGGVITITDKDVG